VLELAQPLMMVGSVAGSDGGLVGGFGPEVPAPITMTMSTAVDVTTIRRIKHAEAWPIAKLPLLNLPTPVGRQPMSYWRATPGCTASTSPTPPAHLSTPTLPTTGALSPTSSPNGWHPKRTVHARTVRPRGWSVHLRDGRGAGGAERARVLPHPRRAGARRGRPPPSPTAVRAPNLPGASGSHGRQHRGGPPA
jgi:hypothetical protein